MRKTLVIATVVLVLGMAVPAAIAHTEERADACDQNRQPCQPTGNHNKCKGTRDWLDADDPPGYLTGFTLAEEPETVGAYVHYTGSDGASEDGEVAQPGFFYVETNGFDGFQKSDWKCKSDAHEHAGEWVEHPDQVIL